MDLTHELISTNSSFGFVGLNKLISKIYGIYNTWHILSFRFSTLICTHYVYVHLFLIVINILCSRQVLHILSRSSAQIWVMSPPLLALPRTSCRHRESRTSRASLILRTPPEASCSPYRSAAHQVSGNHPGLQV